MQVRDSVRSANDSRTLLLNIYAQYRTRVQARYTLTSAGNNIYHLAYNSVFPWASRSWQSQSFIVCCSTDGTKRQREYSHERCMWLRGKRRWRDERSWSKLGGWWQCCRKVHDYELPFHSHEKDEDTVHCVDDLPCNCGWDCGYVVVCRQSRQRRRDEHRWQSGHEWRQQLAAVNCWPPLLFLLGGCLCLKQRVRIFGCWCSLQWHYCKFRLIFWLICITKFQLKNKKWYLRLKTSRLLLSFLFVQHLKCFPQLLSLPSLTSCCHHRVLSCIIIVYIVYFIKSLVENKI